MGSRDRFLATVTHGQPDRCPAFTWFTPELTAAVGAKLGVGTWEELETALQVDRWRHVELAYEKPPDYTDRLADLIPGEYLDRPDIQVSDEGAVMCCRAGDATVEDVLWSPLQDVTRVKDLERYPFADPRRLRLPDGAVAQVRQLKDSDVIVTSRLALPFRQAIVLRGFENFLADLLVRPAIADAIYDRLYAFMTAQAVLLAKAGVDYLEVAGTIGLDNRLVLAPDVWRRTDKLRLAEFIRTVKAANPSTVVGFHSPGRLNAIVADLVQIGLDVLSPVPPGPMDPLGLQQCFAGRLVIHGGVDVGKTLQRGTPGQVREMVQRLVAGGGVIVGPSAMLSPTIPVANVLALYEGARG
jgi:uroporphyrinogen decarboxylase